ncbi:transposase [Planktothrix sp. PCC 11201]|uniref:IS701 family transposase n=1 Tax=Planktothrix sp. PCC 11201 TaxID=1729650 RepID=UPI00091D7A04|nr:IS701 family transposase [Planktothrix sp. PCC 11201]SKB11460.1 transposase [Planktothrix sp. PCC 11201]SKB11668.1 transposase [Planktothrix sp. PCC 11201]SKB11960.1 transposase [Planktothrix sp. PCC 11201]SKB12142.1 transposase [Planktothrix sp. PCC 11201]SKB13843.1 transposase [Planktothrix sp. PCC 11201]
MDVELQIIKHLARDAQPTVSVIDEYCQGYKDLFPEVRSYECFKYLHLGIISPIPRKSLPEIAKIVGIRSPQSLHHFLANSPWSARELKERRLARTLKALKEEKIIVIIDETGDRRKGKKTDYVARQYLGSVGKIDRGIVSVNAYGVYKNITFPLVFRVFKPKGTLKEGDVYKTKIEIASEILTELVELGFQIELVLADSLYGESSSFISTLDKFGLPWVLAIRSNHGVWMSSEEKVRANKWCKFERVFSNGESETRYIREIIFGKRSPRTYWEITTDPETMPEASTSFVMTNLTENRNQIKKTLGNLYGLRTWVEYGFRQCKQELGWTDYRLTDFQDIEKWWEIIFCVYLMISFNSEVFRSLSQGSPRESESKKNTTDCSNHQQWNHKEGWKNVLNNLRLIIQPTIILWLIAPWLDVFPDRYLLLGFHKLIQNINQFQSYFPNG